MSVWTHARTLTHKASVILLCSAFCIAGGSLCTSAAQAAGKTSTAPAILPEEENTHPSCAPQSELRPARLQAVIDGDTLQLDNRESVRVLGINTPEINWKDRTKSEPVADDALDLATIFFAGEKTIYLEKGAEPKDPFNRNLAYVFHSDGRSLTQTLLRQGMGFMIAFPPELRRLPCLQALENQARQERLGVWNEEYFGPHKASQLKRQGERAGFRRISGTVTKTKQNPKVWWLELDSQVTLKVPQKSIPSFREAGISLKTLRGQEIIVRGWLQDRGGNPNFKPPVLELTHPTMIESRMP